MNDFKVWSSMFFQKDKKIPVQNMTVSIFMSSLTAPVVKNSHILAGISFIFPETNLKVYQYQI